jgi:hypothetical protein
MALVDWLHLAALGLIVDGRSSTLSSCCRIPQPVVETVKAAVPAG